MQDKNGKELSIGSIVTIRGKVVHLSEQPHGHNMTVETDEDLPGSANPTTKSRVSVNTRQVELVELEEIETPSHDAGNGSGDADDHTKKRAAKKGGSH